VAETERIRIEIGFDGGQIMSALVAPDQAEALERKLASGGEGVIDLEADDGRYTVVARRIVYFKRFAREGRVGFGTQAPG
jgi:hypothetical protein